MSNKGVVKTVKWIVTQALFDLGKPPSGAIYTWLEQKLITYLSLQAPLEGNVGLKCEYYDLGGTARVAAVPPDCIRISKIGLRAGNRVWALTVDNNLAIPENFFSCDSPQDASTPFVNFWPVGGAGWWNNPQYTLGGGQNVNYYRIAGRNIIFDHTIPAGQLIIEYLSNGSDIGADTMIDILYGAALLDYLKAEYCLHRGNKEEKAMYKEFQVRYECNQYNANTLKTDRMSEFIDAMASSTELNLG